MKRRLAKLFQEESSELEDGRLSKVLANLEVKDKLFQKAMDVLKTGKALFPDNKTMRFVLCYWFSLHVFMFNNAPTFVCSFSRQ